MDPVNEDLVDFELPFLQHRSLPPVQSLDETLCTAADLPEEFFERIIDFLADGGTRDDDEHLIEVTKRELGLCSLVNRWWAAAFRPRIFEEITLRSVDDVHTLSSFLQSPGSVVGSYVDYLNLHPSAIGVPWVHLVHTIVWQRLDRRPVVSLHMDHRDEKASSKPLTSVHQLLPRALPPSFSRFTNLEISNHHF